MVDLLTNKFVDGIIKNLEYEKKDSMLIEKLNDLQNVLSEDDFSNNKDEIIKDMAEILVFLQVSMKIHDISIDELSDEFNDKVDEYAKVYKI